MFVLFDLDPEWSYAKPSLKNRTAKPSVGTVLAYSGRYGEFEPDKAQYSTPNLFDQLFLITRSKQGLGLGGLASRGSPAI